MNMPLLLMGLLVFIGIYDLQLFYNVVLIILTENLLTIYVVFRKIRHRQRYVQGLTSTRGNRKKKVFLVYSESNVVEWSQTICYCT